MRSSDFFFSPSTRLSEPFDNLAANSLDEPLYTEATLLPKAISHQPVEAYGAGHWIVTRLGGGGHEFPGSSVGRAPKA